jgi:hypothetical protein
LDKRTECGRASAESVNLIFERLFDLNRLDPEGAEAFHVVGVHICAVVGLLLMSENGLVMSDGCPWTLKFDWLRLEHIRLELEYACFFAAILYRLNQSGLFDGEDGQCLLNLVGSYILTSPVDGFQIHFFCEKLENILRLNCVPNVSLVMETIYVDLNIPKDPVLKLLRLRMKNHCTEYLLKKFCVVPKDYGPSFHNFDGVAKILVPRVNEVLISVCFLLFEICFSFDNDSPRRI